MPAAEENSEIHPNGQVREKYTLKEGKVDGLFSSYSTSGELLHNANFAQGALHGEAVTYTPDGLMA
jgi:antitoxin component YwqK of YwqJK toxin-antitoxin module